MNSIKGIRKVNQMTYDLIKVEFAEQLKEYGHLKGEVLNIVKTELFPNICNSWITENRYIKIRIR